MRQEIGIKVPQNPRAGEAKNKRAREMHDPAPPDDTNGEPVGRKAKDDACEPGQLLRVIMTSVGHGAGSRYIFGVFCLSIPCINRTK